MHSVFTAEVIKVVRAGLDKERHEAVDVSRHIHIYRKEIGKLTTRSAIKQSLRITS